MRKRSHGPSRRAALGLFAGAVALPRAALAGPVETLTGHAFGTGWRITAPEGADLRRLRTGLEELFAGIDAQLSPWRGDSVLSRFNADPAGRAATDPALTHVGGAALEIARLSNGAFDPTVGPLVARWGFGPITQGGGPDWRGVAAGPDGLTKARDDLTLDLCGIAKGWALDRAAALAREAGVESLLFDLGGEFVVRGHHPAGRAWRVAVDSPIPGAPPPAALRLDDGMALATSGTALQGYTLQGRLYSHVIDPRARAPAGGALRSVTVAAEKAITADGWATALLAAGDEAGPVLARSLGISALFLFAEAGGLRRLATGAMAEMLI
ncbi:FAD:protein FMN transferase [Sagittula salina]|uniref:FAD:protein FMN transferase n=1 Tax=Sagittula salina TaxID=2820268 RepID=A0A940MRL6_9RHOB|nr:FAD:protein FMN transferase [Sagittula salina]MBP0483526.1 FAD:protein FMN transferase [Sagittula salina]